MEAAALLFETIQFVMRETSLFAAVGLLILGLSDLGVDLIWLFLAATGRLSNGVPIRAFKEVPAPRAPGRIAVLVAAWDEAAVIADMLRHSAAAFAGADYRLYVGCYANDPDTIAAVEGVENPYVRIVVGPGGIM